ALCDLGILRTGGAHTGDGTRDHGDEQASWHISSQAGVRLLRTKIFDLSKGHVRGAQLCRFSLTDCPTSAYVNLTGPTAIRESSRGATTFSGGNDFERSQDHITPDKHRFQVGAIRIGLCWRGASFGVCGP